MEQELGERNGFCQIKAVLSVLGFLTKSSIATIKTKKNISNLECEYMKLHSNITKFEKLCEKFPELKSIDFFTPGLIAVLTELVGHINCKAKSVENDAETEEAILDKLVEQCKKVCKDFAKSNVFFENTPNGRQCKFVCPTCHDSQSLSSSFYAPTGNCSYTIHNFRRHMLKHQDLLDSSTAAGTNKGSDTKEKKTSTVSDLKNNQQPIAVEVDGKGGCDRCGALNNQIAEKDMIISSLEQDLANIKDAQGTCGHLLMNKDAKIKSCEQDLEVASTISESNSELEKQLAKIEMERKNLEKLLTEKIEIIKGYDQRLEVASTSTESNSELKKQMATIETERENLKKLLTGKIEIIKEYDQRLEIASKNCNTMQLPCDKCDSLSNELQETKKMLVNYETQEAELKFLRNQHAKNHRMFSVKLCSFEPIENTDSFKFGEDGSVQFTGKNC